MSQLARISRGVRAALRNHPSMLFIEKRASSTYHGLPNYWLKKSNPRKVYPSYLNPNGITNPRPPFLPSSSSSSSLPYATSTDKEGGTSKGKAKDEYQVETDCLNKSFKEQVKILMILLDYDEPEYHLIDGLKVLLTVSETWKKFHPDFDSDYGVVDLEIPRILFRLSQYLKVHKNATSKKVNAAEWMILGLLFGYEDPEFGSVVLSGVMRIWTSIIEDIERECVNAESGNKNKADEEEVYYAFPLPVIAGLQNYKLSISKFDDPDAIIEDARAQWKEAKAQKEEEK